MESTIGNSSRSLEVVKVVNLADSNRCMVINEKDFDPEIHTPWEDRYIPKKKKKRSYTRKKPAAKSKKAATK